MLVGKIFPLFHLKHQFRQLQSDHSLQNLNFVNALWVSGGKQRTTIVYLYRLVIIIYHSSQCKVDFLSNVGIRYKKKRSSTSESIKTYVSALFGRVASHPYPADVRPPIWNVFGCHQIAARWKDYWSINVSVFYAIDGYFPFGFTLNWIFTHRQSVGLVASSRRKFINI